MVPQVQVSPSWQRHVPLRQMEHSLQFHQLTWSQSGWERVRDLSSNYLSWLEKRNLLLSLLMRLTHYVEVDQRVRMRHQEE